ncbi:hypothetical protein PPTS312_28650 [Pseudomonas putida]|uniref:Uncharacterized protein n=1 Tax=Pseudomonas putida TaxID=303 RepID=A0A7U6M2U5_PSEPU|nr:MULTISPECIES: hypothetical protein [Pseudomonas]MDD2124154.1 hypothetical protein [Pseudomonas monteilii]BBU44950.1 hypothetical protein PPTS312_28650 [Pseudomonas putida]
MSNSISGTAALAQPVLIPLILTGRAGQRIEKEAVKSVAAEHREKLRAAKRAVENKAVEYADIMLDQHIAAALNPATDPKLARQLRMDIIELSRARDADPDDAKQRDTAAQKLLDALGAWSVANRAVEEAGKAVPRIERNEKDITPPSDIDLGEFFEGDDDNG